jgi:hypothetical protein
MATGSVGFPLIDNWRLGPQDKLPSELANNKGKNKYYMLPLLMGNFGICLFIPQRPQTVLGDAIAVFVYGTGAESLSQRTGF